MLDFPVPRKQVTFDLETYDPNLKSKGPGTFRLDGFIVGIAIKIDDLPTTYLPMTLGKSNIVTCLNNLLNTPIPKLGANILYDLEWLHSIGVSVSGLKYDVQVAEPLIDENKFSYSLESLSKKYFNESKLYDELLSCAQRINPRIKSKTEVYKVLHQLPADIVGKYAIQDVELTYKVFQQQLKVLKEEQLLDAFMLETKLIDCLLQMRITGVPVNIPRAEQVRDQLAKDEKDLQNQLNLVAGFEVQIWAAESISRVFDKLGLSYLRTPKTQAPSFTAPWLDAHPSATAKLIVKLRKVSKMRNDFIESMILNSHANGRIHTQFHPVKHDDGGTVSGRFSSSNPNLQQVPARDPVYGPLVRSMFVPDTGFLWNKNDYKQQEPRVTVHYAMLKNFQGAAEAVQKYHDNPDTDYHQMVADMCNIERRPAKDINLGLAYGMGVNKMASRLNKTVDETKELFNRYHNGVPFVKLLSNSCMQVAATRGYIKTISGRRRRFNLWAPSTYNKDVVNTPLPFDEAKEKYGLPLKRAFTHKALNSLIQGTSADMIKKAMLDVYEAGHLIYLTVHDEINCPVHNEDEAKEIAEIMCNTYRLQVPLAVDSYVKESWGDCHD